MTLINPTNATFTFQQIIRTLFFVSIYKNSLEPKKKKKSFNFFYYKEKRKLSLSIWSNCTAAKFVGVRSPIPYRWRKYGIPLLKYGMNFAFGGTGVFQTLYPGPNMTTQIDTFHHLITDNVFTIRDLQSSVALVTLSGNDYAYIASSGGSAAVRIYYS